MSTLIIISFCVAVAVLIGIWIGLEITLYSLEKHYIKYGNLTRYEKYIETRIMADTMEEEL